MARRGTDPSSRAGDSRPVVITDAAEDPEVELRRREIRYVTMMLLRVVCLVGAALIVANKPPLWGLWAILCVSGTVLLPWFAVILANDAPPRSRRPPTPSAQPAVDQREQKVIEHDE
jgi:hypothetical protein